MNRHLKLTESCFYNSKNSTIFSSFSLEGPLTKTGNRPPFCPVYHVLNTATALRQQSNSMNLVICPVNFFYHNIPNSTPTIDAKFSSPLR